MATFGVNCGHTKSGYGSGAVGIISESVETRRVGYEVMKLIREGGHKVVDCTIDYASNVRESLSKITDVANNVNLDWFISIHFNAGGGRGTEVYTYEGRQYEDAMQVCSNISKLGFRNRGVKAGTGLYVIRRTKAKSMLIEVCFVDTEDANNYLNLGYKALAKAIVEALIGYVNSIETKGTSHVNTNSNKNISDKKGYIFNVQTCVNVREVPGGKVVGTLQDKTNLVLDRWDGDWIYIKKPINGCVFRKYVHILDNVTSPKPSTKSTNINGKCTPTTELNVRAGVGTNFDKIGMVYPGGELKISEQNGNWYKISYVTYSGSTKTGWVSSKYVRKI